MTGADAGTEHTYEIGKVPSKHAAHTRKVTDACTEHTHKKLNDARFSPKLK
jgi:hypothetical protein